MKNKKQNKNHLKTEKKRRVFLLPESERVVLGIAMFLAAFILILAFFNLAGPAGGVLVKTLFFLFGKVTFLIPFCFVLAGFIFFNLSPSKDLLKMEKPFYFPAFLGILFLVIGVSGILGVLGVEKREGGVLGYLATWPFLRFFGFWATLIIFSGLFLAGGVIIKPLFKREKEEKPEEEKEKKEAQIIHLFKKVVPVPKLKVKEISESASQKTKEIFVADAGSISFKVKKIEKAPVLSFKLPPIDFLEEDRGQPSSGDINQNSAIIQRTLENFGIPVQMSEIFVGPTVTQYTLKPADGVKLSKITTLSNDLSLALAAHPIRIEAPIPGKPLVGIEVPNKGRTQVRMKSLITSPVFQNAPNLTFSVGRDVAGNLYFADLRKMPHLLIAGSTGSGKTIGLNTLLASLLYKNGPEALRLILIDPKRVEFSIYAGIPHLLAPVIHDAHKAVNALRWLVKEMERRFIVLSEAKAREISLYNEMAAKDEDMEPLPFIVLVIDELADLMAARGKDMEATIVRLAQMARAVGIHLVLATQRPSVEVITGLIKANITARIAFSVASQVDSRTILDSSGAEKLLGAGDLLFVSAETSKPKRIQGAFISEKEVKKITDFLREEGENKKSLISSEFEDSLAQELEREAENQGNGLMLSGSDNSGSDYMGTDSLLGEAKKIVIESRKASASLLQRRLRVGYARAARLLDILEEGGVIGPADGAKPREVFLPNSGDEFGVEDISMQTEPAAARDNATNQDNGPEFSSANDNEVESEESETSVQEPNEGEENKQWQKI